MTIFRAFALSAVFLVSFLTTAQAAPFEVLLSSNGSSRSFSFDNVEDAINTFSGTSLDQLLPTYTPGSAATANVNLRGLAATLSYSAGSPTLTLSIPSIGLNRSFTGANRDASQDRLEEFFQGADGDAVLTQILQKLASSTPIDPIAGNPNALMSRMGDADFARGTQYREGLSFAADKNAFTNGFSTEADAGWFSTDVADQTVISAALNYNRAIGREGYAFLVDLPLTYIESEGALAYQASVGTGLRVPLADRWSVTPMLRVGAGGSEDLGAAAIIYSGTVTSDYRIPLTARDQFQIGNMAGYYKTDGITVGDYRVDYDLSNIRLKNGVALAHQFGLQTLPWTGRVFLNDSRFFGDDLFNNNYQEAGLSLGKQLGRYTALQLSGSYLYADGYDGARIGLDLDF